MVNRTIYKEKKLFKGFDKKKVKSSRNIENIKENLNFQSKKGNSNVINNIVEDLSNV